MPKTNNKTIRQNVEAILRDMPMSRDDDKILIITYWNVIDGIVDKEGMVDPYNIFDKATTPESITRARRLVQAEGKYLPTDPTVAARRNKEVEMRKAVKLGEVV